MEKNKERWRELCELASTEQDSKKLLELVREINQLLNNKLERLHSREGDSNSGDSLRPSGSA